MFMLCDGVKFIDGVLFDVKVVVCNFLNVCELLYVVGSQFVWLILYVVDVKMLDEYIVVIMFDVLYVLFLMFVGWLLLLLLNVFDWFGLKFGGFDIVGIGLFILCCYVKGQEIEFVKNFDYCWVLLIVGYQGFVYFDWVVYWFLFEQLVCIGVLLFGQVDVIEGVFGNDVVLICKNVDFIYCCVFNIGMLYLLFLNVGYGVMQDVKVCCVLFEGFDMIGIVQLIYCGECMCVWGIMLLIDLFYDVLIEKIYGNNLKFVNQLLDEVGWSVCDSGGYCMKYGEWLMIVVVQVQVIVCDQCDVLLQVLQV